MSPQAWERLFTKSGLLDSERAKQAAAAPHPLQFVVDQGWATRERALQSISAALKIAFTTFDKDAVDSALVDEIGAQRWQLKSVIPLASNSHIVRLAMANPMDLMTVDEFTVTLRRQVEPVLALPADIDVQYRLLQAQHLPNGLKVCPKCEGDLIPIVYGYPDPQMVESADRGEILLGGCIVSDSDPQFRCKNCGRQYL